MNLRWEHKREFETSNNKRTQVVTITAKRTINTGKKHNLRIKSEKTNPN